MDLDGITVGLRPVPTKKTIDDDTDEFDKETDVDKDELDKDTEYIEKLKKKEKMMK